MKVVLFIVAVLWIACGSFLIIYTQRARRVFEKLLFIKNLKWTAVIPLIFGAALVVGAFVQREVFWIAIALGVLGILKGILIILLPQDRIRRTMEWWLHRADDGTLRLLGLITFTLGCAIFFYPA